MLSVLVKIISLDLAATLSPGILALALVLLGEKNHRMRRILALLFGTLIVAIVIAWLGYGLGDSFQGDGKQSLTSAIIDATLGIFFLFYGIKIFFSKERKIKSLTGEEKHTVSKWVIIGIIINATNFDAVFLSFTAAKEVGVAKISEVYDLILLLVNILFFILPITLPLFIYLIMPNLAGRILEKINVFVLKYSRYIIAALFLIFGVYLAYKGIKFI